MPINEIGRGCQSAGSCVHAATAASPLLFANSAFMAVQTIAPGHISVIGRTNPRAESLFYWARRAFRREVLDFRFTYDVEAVTVRKSPLEYHVRSEHLFFDAMRLDEDGVPIHWSRTFRSYNPMYVAWYGLASLHRWCRGTDPEGREIFLRQVNWLVENVARRDDGVLVWPLTFDWLEGRAQLRAPWPSSMAQGLALSALVRAERLGANESLLPLIHRGLDLFELPLEQGGVVSRENGFPLYEEYPARPLPRILDGFLFSLLGLYDVAELTKDERAQQLLASGLDGLEDQLSFWDYRGKWSWYGSHGYLCPPHYHNLNAKLLHVLGVLTGREALIARARQWDVSRRSFAGRAEIFTMFQLTKNISRARYHARRVLRGRVRSAR